jgi:hypothetical protein
MKQRISMLGIALAIGLAALPGCGSDSTRPTTATPLTVEQLLARSADTPIEVQGFLHVEQGRTRLCAAILESYPPQCGLPSAELVDLDLSTVDGTTTAENVTWKEGVVLQLERAGDGRFIVIAVDTGS